MMRDLSRPLVGMIVLAALAALLGCGRNDVSHKTSLELARALGDIADKRIFFGHQSVGGNVLDGLAGLEELGLPIVDIRREGRNASAAGPAILHAEIGRNEYPAEKIADFADIMRSGMAVTTDISFMKFCYVDSGNEMSAEEILAAYVDEMERLEAEFPQTTFVYLTMPLTALRTDIRGRIKRLLGIPEDSLADNVERNRFNNLLRAEKGSTGRLFDIAAIESTRPNGTRELFGMGGEQFEALVRDYTYDGGHLNDLGRRRVAEQLVLFLADLE